jgi:hypothetical protein
MTRHVPRTAVVVLTLMAALAVPAATLATAPSTSPTVTYPIPFAAGTLCEHAILFENLEINARDSLFAPGPSGRQRLLQRGFGASRVTDQDSGNSMEFKGGFAISVVFAADGTIRVDAAGTDVLAWYFAGDDSELGPGIFHVTGHVTEWYASDGSFLRAAYSGTSVNVCNALAG